MNGKTDDKNNERATSIIEMGSVITQSDGRHIGLVTVIGQVEGHTALGEGQKTTKYEHIIPLLVALNESDDIYGVMVVLNTVGGDVEAGLAIAEMISGMTKPTVSLVLGGGHSIGIPIAVSCDRSFIVPSATMTVHPVRISGTVLGVPQAFESMRRMQSRINDFVLSHSRITSDELHRLMTGTDELVTDIGSVIDGRQAVECGLIDCVGGLGDAVAALKSMRSKDKGGKKNDGNGK
ncbi:MAG: ATP-dependent Clp protease proteolytic subunit [Clostridia bacterium]|nr:ATP-dependent Clp protease proteolytic subunit [Clostridia bacterium]